MEPIGRALDHPEILLDDADWKRLFDFIREKRMEDMPVTYGCSHYLGLDYEREVREHYYLCNAGIYVASIMCNGDIGSCLDIEKRPETIQGNILRDRFKDVWEQRFEIFRKDKAGLNETCRACNVREFCHGGATHSWDFDKNEPRVCFKHLFLQDCCFNDNRNCRDYRHHIKEIRGNYHQEKHIRHHHQGHNHHDPEDNLPRNSLLVGA